MYDGCSKQNKKKAIFILTKTQKSPPFLSVQCIKTKTTVKPVFSGHSKRPKIGFQDGLMLNAGQKYCSVLQGEHSAILLTFIKLPFVINIFVLSIFEWPLTTGFTVCDFPPCIQA